jgi:hypothetical protein
MSNLVHKPLAPLSNIIQILGFNITADLMKEGSKCRLMTTVNKIKTVPNSDECRGYRD